MSAEDEEKQLRAAALLNVRSILQARQRAEQELLRTKEALEEETRILEILNETGVKLASKLDLHTVVQAVTDAATQLSGAQFGAFFYTSKDDGGNAMSLYTLCGAPREAFEAFGHPRATPIFEPTFRGEGVLRIADVHADPRYGKMGPHFGMPKGHLPVRSYLAVPVLARGGGVLGALFFGHENPGVFTDRSERLTVAIAAQASIAIDNARLYEDAKRAAAERSLLLEAERAARMDVERASLAKDEFLATLSHELITPLNAVLGWTHVLLSRAKAGTPEHAGLEAIARNARSQAKLIEDLLDMNRVVSGKIRLDTQPLDLAPVIDAALESVRPATEAKSIEMSKTTESCVVLGDPNRLQQVVWNLLSNAVKFTPKGGRIDVSALRRDGQVEISVRDSGMGIAATFLPHLFERFRQADSSTTRRYGGLGLGLAIAKQLVDLHGGTIHAASPGEGAGATLTVTLPLLDRAASSLEPRLFQSPARDQRLQGVTVLVVDDAVDALELLRVTLIDAGAAVVVASSVADALERLRDSPPDVIVSDIGMPDRDGYELIREVRSSPSDRATRVPAIALTAFARVEDRDRALASGFDEHLPKPVFPVVLVAAIERIIARR